MGKTVFIIGGDPFYRKGVRESIEAKLPSSLSQVKLFSPSPSELKREIAPSLFGDIRLVKIEDLVYKNEMTELFSAFLSSDFYNVILLIEDLDVEKSRTIEKKLTGLGDDTRIESHFLSGSMKPKEKLKFVREHALEIGVEIAPDAIELLCDYCNDNLSIVHEELVKLKLISSIITKQHILYYLTPFGNSKDSIQFYISLMNGDSVRSVAIAREISKDEGTEIVLGSLVNLSFLVLMLHHVNGNDKLLMDFLKKKRLPVNIGWTSNDKDEVNVKSSQVPSPFVMRVAKKLYDRVGSRSFWSNLFTQCYDSYVEYRVTANENIASAGMEKTICIISRS